MSPGDEGGGEGRDFGTFNQIISNQKGKFLIKIYLEF